MLDEREGGRHQIHPCFRTILLSYLHGVRIETNKLLSADSFDFKKLSMSWSVLSQFWPQIGCIAGVRSKVLATSASRVQLNRGVHFIDDNICLCLVTIGEWDRRSKNRMEFETIFLDSQT